MIELLGKSLLELQEICLEGGFPKFRAKQIMDYIYHRHIFDFDTMLQLPGPMREWLKQNCSMSLPKVLTQSVAPDGNTRKLLLELKDGSRVETVLMAQHYGNSVCVSSQCGCAMGCIFCASTTGGLHRDLEAYEIIAQVLLFASLLGEDIHSMVVMGSGEPLQNYEQVVKALRLIHEKETFNISYRKMTLSTCGWVDNIYRLADEGIPITLALSLHAVSQDQRMSLMPVGARYSLDQVLEAVQYYYHKTQRRVTFEYILIKDRNDSLEEAHKLGMIAKDFPNCNVNLIPVNGNEHINLYKPSINHMKQFKEIVESYGVSATIRKEMGDTIQAACGQLKAQQAQVEKEGH